ncbi:MAG: hypothetical protein RLZZ127_761 [Planctomycetota bacterium]|jgi:thiol-disulfide isomerase/thioredoxin
MRTESAMVPLGTALPAIRLPDTATGRQVDLGSIPAPCLVVMVLCNHCPFVLHLADALGALAAEHPAGGPVALVGINANDPVAHPEDAPERMPAMAAAHGWTFPYLHDADQGAVTALRAACTPDFFVYGPDRRLAYRGQFDDSRPARKGLDGTRPITGADLRAAIRAVLAGTAPAALQRPSLGCNVKWIPGREPPWFHG